MVVLNSSTPPPCLSVLTDPICPQVLTCCYRTSSQNVMLRSSEASLLLECTFGIAKLDIWRYFCHTLARMSYEITLSPHARAQFRVLSAYNRAKVRDAIDTHLQHRPTAESKSRIKRLRGLRKPQYRLRVDDLRVFYDVEGGAVIIHGIVDEPHASEWLAEEGEPS